MVIDVGADAVDRTSQYSLSNHTIIAKDNPANASGTITSVEIYAVEDLLACSVGIFYITDGNTLKCRSKIYLGTVTAGSKQTFAVSLPVQAGDYIGLYHNGKIEADLTGAGVWWLADNRVYVGSEATYYSYASVAISLYGTGGEVEVGAPAVTALPASAVTSTAARSNGEITDTGSEEPAVHIYWGTSDGGTTPGDWDHDENLGTLGIGTFYKDISGLTRGTKYYYRCYAENSGGSTWSNAVEFTTLLEKPIAASNAATGVGVSAATLNGTATDDGGGSCQYRFRYKKAGGDYVYTDWTGAKTTGETFSEGITGLDAGSTYYFNAQVKNSQFTSEWGAELTFNTGAVVVAPTGITTDPTLVADIEATLNGEVTNDGGEACEVRFQYYTGGDTWTDNETAWQPGKLTNDTFAQKINGLTPNTLYHSRAQIKNSVGTVDGADKPFTTEYFPTPFLTRVLRDVFGGGANINAANPLQVYDPKVAGNQLIYKDILYVDANPAVGSDANDGTRESPYLTIQAAVNAASEYTTIFCADSRTGAAAVGFDEKTTIAGVVINTNYITVIGCKLFGDRSFSGNVPITNSIANADYVFSGSGIGVAVCGFSLILANANGDEKCIYLTGNGALVIHCDVTQSAGAHGFIGIHLTGDDVHVRRCHGRWFDDDVIRLEGCVMGHIEESIIGAGVNGIHLLTGCLGCVAERCDILANTVGVLVDAGATYNHVCMPHFSNNTTDFTNNGGATNSIINAHKESQISTGNTVEDDLKSVYDQGAHVALCITEWGGFEDEVLLKAAADPAALDAATKLTPTLPAGATVWKAYLIMKFREIYCAGANFIATAGSVQLQKSTAGSWVTGITIPIGTLDVAAGASAPGDCLMGNADVSAQVASGEEVEFQLVTLRSNADDLALRDMQFGLQIYFTI